jgi:hypothetical protein
MRWTGASERTVKHWLAGTHGPCGDHLLVLMQESAVMLEAILTAVERRDAVIATRMLAAQSTMMDVVALIGHEQMTPRSAGALAAEASRPEAPRAPGGREHDRNHDRNHELDLVWPIGGMSARRSWFLEALRAGTRVGVAELEERWGVSEKTAQRDIGALKARGLIEFVGSRRSGAYRLVAPALGPLGGPDRL